MPRLILGILFAITLYGRPAGADTAPPEPPAVAVLDFDYGAVTVRWPAVMGRRTGPINPTIEVEDVGRGIANLLVAELAGGGGVRLLERQRFSEVSREQAIGHVPAQYLVLGTVTKFGGEQRTRSGFKLAGALFAAGQPLFGMLAGMLQVKDTHGYVDLSYRVVDASTGYLVGAATVSGKSRRRGLLLVGRGRRGPTGPVLSLESSDFQATILGEATVAAVRNAAERLRSLLAGVS